MEEIVTLTAENARLAQENAWLKAEIDRVNVILERVGRGIRRDNAALRVAIENTTARVRAQSQ